MRHSLLTSSLAAIGLLVTSGAAKAEKDLPTWFGRSGPLPYLSMKLSNFDCGPTDTLVPYTKGKPINVRDLALHAYLAAFKDYRLGHLEEAVHNMFPKPGKKISSYQVVYLSVAYMISLELSGEARRSIELSRTLVYDKNGSETVQTPLGYLLLACFKSHFQYSKARVVLGESVQRFPNEKGLWDCYTWACESGETPVGQKFDPKSPLFGYAEAVDARTIMAKKWPSDDYNLVVLAQDLDLLGHKSKALEIIEDVVRRHKTKDDTGNRARALLAYFKKGGFKG